MSPPASSTRKRAAGPAWPSSATFSAAAKRRKSGPPQRVATAGADTRLAKRIIACLDVRSNDAGDLVVTKGDQYDVRAEGEVRNLGRPVDLARRYYEEGADEITFLNITGFRDFPLEDQPMLEVLKRTSENVFVPLTIGGGIKSFTATDGRHYSAVDVASEYFRSGADKISIGSDAVYEVEKYLASGRRTGESSIEQISIVYGAQAVVISIDPRRVYVESPEKTRHATLHTAFPGPNGEEYCWYQCTVRGGREGRDIDVVQLAQVCELLGAGEILLNCIDRDGTNSGFDLELIGMVQGCGGHSRYCLKRRRQRRSFCRGLSGNRSGCGPGRRHISPAGSDYCRGQRGGGGCRHRGAHLSSCSPDAAFRLTLQTAGK